MCIVEDISLWLRTIYRLLGIIQFSCTQKSQFLSFLYRLHCVPVFLLYGYSCFSWLSFVLNIFDRKSVKIDTTVSFVGVLTTTTSMLILVYRSNNLRSLLLKLDEIKRHSCVVTQNAKRDWFKISMWIITMLHLAFVPTLRQWLISSVYYYMPPTIGFCDHLFLDKILECVRSEFVVINQQVLSLRTRIRANPHVKNKETQSMYHLVEELTLRHCDLVTLVLDINKLFDLITLSSMLTWFAYFVDVIYVFVDVLRRVTVRADLVMFVGINLTFMILWLLIMVRAYSRTQQEVKARFIPLPLYVFFGRQRKRLGLFMICGIICAKIRELIEECTTWS